MLAKIDNKAEIEYCITNGHSPIYKGNYFLVILALPAIIMCSYYLLDLVGMVQLFNAMYIYILVIIYMICTIFSTPFCKVKFLKNDFLAILLVYLGFAFSFIISNNDAKQYYITTEMTLVYLLYIPSCVCVLSKSSDWHYLFYKKTTYYFADILILIAFIYKLLNQNLNIDDYMTYSYNLLPLWGIVMVGTLVFHKKEQAVFLLISFVQGLLFGARGPIGFLVVLWIGILVFQIVHTKNLRKHNVKIIITSLIIVLIVGFGIDSLLYSDLSQSSYIFNRMRTGLVYELSGRESIYSACENVMSSMGLSINGLFYDRTFLSNNTYAHNFIYETILSFGWIFGILMLLVFAIYVLKAFKNALKSDAIFFIITITCTLFLRFFISGCIFDEGAFYIFIGCLYPYAIKKRINNNFISYTKR